MTVYFKPVEEIPISNLIDTWLEILSRMKEMLSLEKITLQGEAILLPVVYISRCGFFTS